ncbi:MAG: hypothetical protein ACYDCL_16025 [Myxococcales bacterium]
MRPTRREVAWLLASWLAWGFVALHIRGTRDSPGPWDTILTGTDHMSHIGCAEIFLHHGFQLWARPPVAFCSRKLPPEKAAFLQESACRSFEVCDLPGVPRPVCVNWQDLSPQAYPPGLILFSLPQALLYEHTRLSFRTINVLTILEYLAAAHLLFWVLWRLIFPPPIRDDLLGGVRWELTNPWLRLGLFGFVYFEVIGQVLNGFYDPLAIFATFLGIYFLAKRRPADAILALSASLFLHYRALWYAPVLAFACFKLFSRAAWTSPRKTVAKLAVSAAMLIAFAYSLWLIYPFLRTFPETNPVALRHATLWKTQEWELLLPMAFLLLYLTWGRHWLVLATLGFQLFVILRTPQVMKWHALYLLPVFGVARLDEERGVMLAALVFYLVEASVIFNALPLPGELFSSLAAAWGPWSF